MDRLKDNTRLLPEYKGVDIKHEGFLDIPKDKDLQGCETELAKIVFAPDPVTGIPRSALGMIMSKDTSPEIAAAIKEQLLQSRNPTAGTQNPDEAIATTRTKQMTDKDYEDNLVKFIRDNNDVKFV